MKKLTILSVIFSVIFFATGCIGFKAHTRGDTNHTLVVLHTNDHHGHPMSFFNYPCPGQGGLAARATLVNRVRSEFSNVMVLDAGDLNTGRPESNFFKAEPDIRGYNYIQYDALALGNHEFDQDMTGLQTQIAASNFPWLCANAKYKGQQLIENVRPYFIKEYKGFKVAVLGLVSSRTAETGNPGHIKDIVFEDEVMVALALVPELRKKADIVIALVHMGIWDDADRGSKRLAAKVPGLSLIVDGHTHTELTEPVMVKNTITGKEIPIVQAKDWGLYVGKAVLNFQKNEVTDIKWSLLPVNVQKKAEKDGEKECVFLDNELEKDQKLLSILKPYEDKVQTLLGEVIGSADHAFVNDDTRNRETALGDIVADSQVWYMKKMGFDIDFAFQNGGGIRASLGAGDIKKKTIYEVLPFDNSITVVTLRGADVIALFNQAPANIGRGSMPQVSKGVSFTINTASGKVENLLIHQQPVYPSRRYKIAVNSYLASGGDGYDIFKKYLDFYDSSMMQRDAFVQYIISKGGNISPQTFGRITIK